MQDKDKYIPGENREDPPIGLYKIVKTGDGAPKIKFDDPYSESKKPEDPPDAEGTSPARDTADQPSGTEAGQAVAEEREIEFLRAERAVLEQMIQAAAGPLWEEEDEDEEQETEISDGEARKKERRKPAIH